MKIQIACGLALVLMSFTNKETNFDAAKKTASQKHALIMINFSGSDWCGPCIRMRKEIFESQLFSQMADSTLIFVNADFPRNKKNQLSKEMQQQNEKLADTYNPQGSFPFTVLITADGKLVKSWDGLPNEDVATFTQQVKNICETNK